MQMCVFSAPVLVIPAYTYYHPLKLKAICLLGKKKKKSQKFQVTFGSGMKKIFLGKEDPLITFIYTPSSTPPDFLFMIYVA